MGQKIGRIDEGVFLGENEWRFLLGGQKKSGCNIKRGDCITEVDVRRGFTV